MTTKDINQVMNRLSSVLLKNGTLEYTKNLVKLLSEKWDVSEELSDAELSNLIQQSIPKVVSAKKRTKKKAVNGAPPKNKTAYIIFSTTVREKLSVDEDGNKLPFAEVGKLIGAKWKSLESDEKETYEDQAKEDKQRYLSAMKEFDPEFKEKEKPSPKQKMEDGRDLARVRSSQNDVTYCYNVSTGRLLKHNDKNKSGNKFWDTTSFLCGNTEKEVKACMTDLGLSDAAPKKKRTKSTK